MIYKRTTDPTDLAVPLADVKTHLRVTTSDHDALITSYIEAASRMIEARANIMLKSQIWDLSLKQEEVVEKIEIAKYPITSFLAVTYYDTDNALQSYTHSADEYIVFLDGRPSSLIFDEVPSVYERDDAMQITFYGGYSTVPDDIILAVKMVCWRMYNHPDDPVSERLSFVDKIVRDNRTWQL